MREDTPDLLDCLPSLVRLNAWTVENLEPPERAVCLVSPGPEVTRVCRVCLDVRVCLDFLVLQSGVKDSPAIPAIPGSRGFRASLDRREKPGSLGSPAHLEKEATTVLPVSLEIPERPEDPVVQAYPETALVTQEDPELKAYQEFQASPVAVPLTVPPVTTAFREVRASPVPRGALVKQGARESTEPLVFLGPRVRMDSRVEAEQMGFPVHLVVLVVLDPKVCLDLLVWMDSTAWLDLKACLELQVELPAVERALLAFQA